ncbi:hypothetical protein Tco_0211553 [Tanacetum coccineum]
MQLMQEENVPSFLPTDDPLGRLNKAMALFRSAITSRYPPATIQEGKVDICKALDVSLVVIESSETKLEVQVESSRLGNDIDADDANIRPVYDEEPMAEVQSTAECNIFATGQQHTKQPEFNNEGEIQEKVFAIVALKNELRKSNRNSIDTKFANTSVLGNLVLQPLRNQSVVRQPNAFKSKRPKILKPQFASQVDVEKDLSKPVTQHYLPEGKEPASTKPTHMIASSSSRNSSKNMPRFSSKGMVHNYYLDEAKKKTQERDMNLKTSLMPSARFQSTADDSKPKPRSTNNSTRSLPVSTSSCVTITAVPITYHSKNSNSFSDSKHFICSTCHKCVFNANHVACITKFLKEVNSRAKIQSNKTRNSNKPVEQKIHTRKAVRQIFIGHRFSPNKTSTMYEKTSPRYDLRWKPTGRIFKIVGLRWVPTGKILASCPCKDNNKPTHGSNVDILNIHECKQTLDLSEDTSINV